MKFTDKIGNIAVVNTYLCGFNTNESDARIWGMRGSEGVVTG